MREILFRGKRIDNKRWVEGSYFHAPLTEESCPGAEIEDGLFFLTGYHRDCIATEEGCVCQIDPSTLGQFTGMTDKNGTRIFEGDIVSGTALLRERTGVIVWIELITGFGVRYTERDDPTAWQESSILHDIARHNYSEFCAKVVGNIHDNEEA